MIAFATMLFVLLLMAWLFAPTEKTPVAEAFAAGLQPEPHTA